MTISWRHCQWLGERVRGRAVRSFAVIMRVPDALVRELEAKDIEVVHGRSEEHLDWRTPAKLYP
jgi:hypothetical protein